MVICTVQQVEPLKFYYNKRPITLTWLSTYCFWGSWTIFSVYAFLPNPVFCSLKLASFNGKGIMDHGSCYHSINVIRNSLRHRDLIRRLLLCITTCCWLKHSHSKASTILGLMIGTFSASRMTEVC